MYVVGDTETHHVALKVRNIQELADELGYKRTTVYAHLTRELWHKIPQPSLRISCGPVWYQGDVDEWRNIRKGRKV